MKSHITNSELAAYIAESLKPGARERVAGHIARCDACRAGYERMLRAVSPGYRSLRARAAVKERVMAYRDKAARDESEARPSKIGSLLALHPVASIAAAFAAAAVIIVTALLLLRAPFEETRLYLSAEQADTGVYINDRPATGQARVYDAGTVILPDKTMARLTYGPGFSITLVGPGTFAVDRFVSRGKQRAELECTLTQGILVSAAAGSDIRLSYAYNTPGARVEPSGTEFLVQASGENTLVVLKTGSARVTTARTGQSSIVSAGSRCQVAEKTAVSPAEPEDMKMFNNLKQLRDGAYSRRLLPTAPQKDRPDQKLKGEKPGRDRQSGRDTIGNRERTAPDSRETRDKESGREKIEKSDTSGREGLDKNREMLRDSRKDRRETLRDRMRTRK